MSKERKRFIENHRAGRPAFYAVFLLICILLAGAGIICLRLRGGVQVKAPQGGEYLPGKEIVFFRQDDERWGENRLGASKYTMRSSGCLVSCIASAISMESGEEVAPGTLNRKFSDGNVYDAAGNLQWEPLDGLGEYQVTVYELVSSEQIDACLAAGHFPIVRVRMYALGNVHYVLIVGAEDGEYLCMDPLRDEVRKLSAYGNRVYVMRCVSLAEPKEEVSH